MWSGADASYLAAITAPGRKYTWHGTLTDTDGTTYNFTAADIVQGSGQLSRKVSADNSLDIGTVYTSELVIRLYLTVDRYKLYGGTIDLFCDVDVNGSTYNVPMGVYTISACTQELSCISITAYDAMMQLEGTQVDTDQGQADPYTWLVYLSRLAGVTLGTSQADLEALPNGQETLSFKETDDPLTDMSCRQALAYICACLGANAYIGRDGLLYIRPYDMTPIDDIAANERLSSSISDYTTKYTAVSMTVADTGTTEYYAVEPDDGLTYQLGANPWLQFKEAADRARVCGAIVTGISAIEYVPYSLTMMLRPELDPMDVLTLSGNQASNDLGGITSIVYKLSGAMIVKCAGGNPKLASATSRTAKAAAAAGKAASRKAIFYTYTNLDDLTINDGETRTAILFGISSTKNSSVIFHAEIPHEISTNETYAIGTDTYTDDDCRVSVEYYINNRLQEYAPVYVEEDTDNVLHLMFYFTIAAGGLVEFFVKISCQGGTMYIPAGNIKSYVYGSEIGSLGEYGREINIVADDEVTPFRVSSLYRSVINGLTEDVEYVTR